MDVTYTGDDGTVITVKTNQNGEYYITPVPENTSGTISYKTDSPRQIAGDKKVTVEEEDQEIQDAVIEPSTHVSGSVTDPEGNPLPNTEVTFTDII